MAVYFGYPLVVPEFYNSKIAADKISDEIWHSKFLLDRVSSETLEEFVR